MGRQTVTDRILLIDHQPIYRGGLRTALTHGGFAVVGEAASAHCGLRAAEEFCPEIVIIEALLPGISGFVTAAYIQRTLPGTRIIMIASAHCPTLTARAIKVGAVAFIQKSDEPETIIETVRAVQKGHNVLQQWALSDESTTRFLLMELRSGCNAKIKHVEPDLSPRELEVLDCLLMGFANREIAEALFITEQTVKNHMTSIMKKLSVSDRVAALRVAMACGWSFLGMPRLVNDPVLAAQT
jgi:DNA-binding NarL/FixJ family response regulator